MAHNEAQKAVHSVHENVYAQYINSSTQNYTLEHKYKQKVGTEQKQRLLVIRETHFNVFCNIPYRF